VGLSAVSLFMISFYGLLGFIATIALFIYSLLAFSIFKLIPVTLTLAGIAGFILSIGMAVDANILIFERMKEEIRWGKTKQKAIELGFNRAFSSIRDSNVSSLITCVILYYFGSGIIRGFALTLAIGILLSMFSAITITKTFLKYLFLRDSQKIEGNQNV
jgi:preprotein translocase subunit SecD